MDTPTPKKITEITDSIFATVIDSDLRDRWERRKIIRQIAQEIGKHWPKTHLQSGMSIAERRVENECRKRGLR